MRDCSATPATAKKSSPSILAAAMVFTVLVAGACFSREPHGYCEGAEQCGKGEACLVGRCSPLAEPAVAPESRRVVLYPSDVAVLSSTSAERLDAEVVPFGRESLGEVIVLLHFDTRVTENIEVTRAILTMDPAERAPAPISPVSLNVAWIEDSWQSEVVSWGRAPRLSVGDRVPKAPVQGHGRFRVDVTKLFHSSNGLKNGIAISADGKDPIGAVFSTGLGGGTAPRLELYLIDNSPAPVPSSVPSASASASASAAPSASASASSKPDDDDDPVPRPKPKPKPKPKKKL